MNDKTKPAATGATPKKPEPKVLTANRVHLRQFVRADYDIEFPSDVTVDDVKRPEFWQVMTHVGEDRKLHPMAGDRIEGFSEDGRRWFSLLVVDSAPGKVAVDVLDAREYPEPSLDMVDTFEGYEIIRASRSEGGYLIRRKENGLLIRSHGGTSFPDQRSARRHLEDANFARQHERAVIHI